MPKDNQWLQDVVEEHIINNPGKDSVDIVTHFKLRADITMGALSDLEDNCLIERYHIGGLRHGYRSLKT